MKYKVVDYKIKPNVPLSYPKIQRIEKGCRYDFGENGSLEIWGEISEGDEGLTITALLLGVPGYEFEVDNGNKKN